MTTRRLLRCLLFIWLVLSFNETGPQAVRSAATAAPTSQRLQFRITTVEEKMAQRHVLSEVVIEGPPGTDFDINFRDQRFTLEAHFLTDLMTDDALKVRAKLNTKRFYGYSERDLPLYEEDAQRHTLRVGFDEALVLLPFGRNDSGDKLKIEITPQLINQIATAKPQPLKIDIVKDLLNGVINVQAHASPHHFKLEAALLENGQEVARGEANLLLDEPSELILESVGQANLDAAAHPLIVNLTLDSYSRSRPTDAFTISFGLQRGNRLQGGKREPVASNWAGAGNFDEALTYDLTQDYLPASGNKYALKLTLRSVENRP